MERVRARERALIIGVCVCVLTRSGLCTGSRQSPRGRAIAGALGDAVLGKTLKRVLKQKRPDGAPLVDPGMPSSHDMSVFFLSGYLCAVNVAWTPERQQRKREGGHAGVHAVARGVVCVERGVGVVCLGLANPSNLNPYFETLNSEPSNRCHNRQQGG